MANTNITQISNLFNLMVQMEPRLFVYHFGWRSDINKNIDNNFDPDNLKGRQYPSLAWVVPEFSQYLDAVDYVGLKEELEITLYFDDLQDYNNDGSVETDNLIEQWEDLKQIAEDFVANFEVVLCHYNAGGIMKKPRFEPFSHGHNDRLITWRVEFTIMHLINCTDEANKIDVTSLPATIPEIDIENYKS